MNLQNESIAVEQTVTELRRVYNYRFKNTLFINKGRYCIVFGKEDNPNIAILLKTEPFFNFSKKFPEEKGVGDSINVNQLRLFVQHNVKDIYIKFRDGKLYTITLLDFLANSHRWVQKEGTEVRSISIHHYKRVEQKCQIQT